MRDVLSNLREHAPSMPSAKEAGDAVRAHLPNVDLDAVRGHLPRSKKPGKWSIAAVIGLLAAAAATLGYRRRRTATTTPGMYTPPLPKP